MNGFVIVSLAVLPLTAGYALYWQYACRAKALDFFPCHYKTEAGTFARLLKMVLTQLKFPSGSQNWTAWFDSDVWQFWANLSHLKDDTRHLTLHLFQKVWNVRGAWVTFHCALQFHTFDDSILYWQEMPTTCGIDEYETNDYISCLHGNDMDICMLKTFFDALGVCSHEKLTGHTSSVLCLLKLSHQLAEKPLWKKKHNRLYSSGPNTFVTLVISPTALAQWQ